MYASITYSSTFSPIMNYTKMNVIDMFVNVFFLICKAIAFELHSYHTFRLFACVCARISGFSAKVSVT